MTRERLKIGGTAATAKPRPPTLPRGVEPPLNLLGADARQIDRRDVNLRWLCASALTGITGALLMGAAIHVSLQGDASLAAGLGSTEPRTPSADAGPRHRGARHRLRA
ncbi:UNVERIFIED_ORG: hypothetical protein M2442_000525 [Methylorubrum zatmanii]|nr:hypothetical protein [Methylorubrum zatmanii]